MQHIVFPVRKICKNNIVLIIYNIHFYKEIQTKYLINLKLLGSLLEYVKFLFWYDDLFI